MYKKWEECNAYLMLYLQSSNHPKFRSTFFQCHLIHRVAFFNDLQLDDRYLFYTMIEPAEFSKIFIKLKSEKQIKIFTELDGSYVVQMLNYMQLNDLVRFFRKLSKQDRDYYMDFMKKPNARKIKTILSYDVHTAGSMMTMEYITASPNETAEEVLNRINKAGKRIETIYYMYIVAEYNRLVGVVSLRRLVIASSEQTMKLLMKEQVITVRPHTHNKMIENVVYDYGLGYIPVVTKNKELIGVVPVNDAEQLRRIQQSYNDKKRKKVIESTLLIKLYPFTTFVLLTVILFVVLASSRFSINNTMLLLLFSLISAGIAGLYGTKKSINVFEFLKDKAKYEKTFVMKKEILKGLLLTITCTIFSGIVVYSLTNGNQLSIAISIALFLSIFSSTITGVFLAYFMGKKDEFSKNRVISINAIVTTVICFTVAMRLFQYI